MWLPLEHKSSMADATTQRLTQAVALFTAGFLQLPGSEQEAVALRLQQPLSVVFRMRTPRVPEGPEDPRGNVDVRVFVVPAAELTEREREFCLTQRICSPWPAGAPSREQLDAVQSITKCDLYNKLGYADPAPLAHYEIKAGMFINLCNVLAQVDLTEGNPFC